MSSRPSIVQMFNEHFMEFVKHISDTFPNDLEVATAKNTLIAVKKVNPKMISKIWKTYIADKYKNEIEEGNINFFIEKNYAEDLVHAGAGNPDRIISSIDRLREPIRNMDDVTRSQTMKYMQNLTKLSAAM